MNQTEQASMGAATTVLAMMVPWGTVAAAGISIVGGIMGAKDSAKAAEKQRDSMVKETTYANRVENNQLRDVMEDTAEAEFNAHLEALHARSKSQTVETGVQGVTRENAANEIGNQLSRQLDNVRRSEDRAKRDVALNKKSRNHGTKGRINSIQRQEYDATSDVLSAGLKIGDHYGKMDGLKTTGRTNKAGAQTVGGT